MMKPTWEELTTYLKAEFSIKGDILSVLFIIGIQESGSGFRHYTQQEKSELVKLAQYTLLSQAGYYRKINITGREPFFIQNDSKSLPSDTTEFNKILKKQIVLYFQNTN